LKAEQTTISQNRSNNGGGQTCLFLMATTMADISRYNVNDIHNNSRDPGCYDGRNKR